jgi:hypothetical protein
MGETSIGWIQEFFFLGRGGQAFCNTELGNIDQSDTWTTLLKKKSTT